MSRGWWLLPAAALEALAGLGAAREAGLAALALHVGASCCAALYVRGKLLERGIWSHGLAFAFALFVPVLGALGLAVLAEALPWPTDPQQAGPQFVRTPVPGAPARAQDRAAPAERPLTERDGRMAALIACRNRQDPTAVAMLWRALGDPEEEVRLLSFSLLDSKTGAAYRRIRADAQELKGARGPRAGALHVRLALEHWELAWLGLVQGEILNHELGVAEEHALAALDSNPTSASMHFLLGRIQLRRGRLAEARAMLERAGDLGLPASVGEPYLAEVGFLERRFDRVREHLARAGVAGGNDARVLVQRYWL